MRQTPRVVGAAFEEHQKEKPRFLGREGTIPWPRRACPGADATVTDGWHLPSLGIVTYHAMSAQSRVNWMVSGQELRMEAAAPGAQCSRSARNPAPKAA